jgi:hypothetical protein
MIDAFQVALSCCTFNFIFANLKHEALRVQATWKKYSEHDQQYLEKITLTFKLSLLHLTPAGADSEESVLRMPLVMFHSVL